MARMGWRAGLLLGACCGVIGCDDDGASTVGDTGVAVEDDVCLTDRPAVDVCSDGQALAIAVAANEGEVDIAMSVRERLTTVVARAIADRVLLDHGNRADADRELAASLGIELVETSISDAVRQEASDAIGELLPLSGAELDRAYVDLLMLDHLGDLGVMDHLLAPSVDDARVAAALAEDRRVVAAHLRVLADAQATLTGACGGD